MNWLSKILSFLTGANAKFGTITNLLREVSIGVLVAVAVAVLVQLMTPPALSPASEMRDMLRYSLAAQHQADSVLGLTRQWELQSRIDSLNLVLLKRDEKDSLRANAGLSDLDAMRKINRAIAADRLRANR